MQVKKVRLCDHRGRTFGRNEVLEMERLVDERKRGLVELLRLNEAVALKSNQV